MRLDRLKAVLVVLGWGASMASVALAAIFQGLLVPGVLRPLAPADPLALGVFYFSIFGVSFLAALVVNEASRSILSFFASYVFAVLLTYTILALPGSLGAFAIPELIVKAAIVFTFAALFPVALIVGLAGTMIGVGFAERLG